MLGGSGADGFEHKLSVGWWVVVLVVVNGGGFKCEEGGPRKRTFNPHLARGEVYFCAEGGVGAGQAGCCGGGGGGGAEGESTRGGDRGNHRYRV